MSRILMFVLAAGLIPAVPAQQTASTQQAGREDSSKSPMTDSDFITKAAESGMKEVEIGKLASDKTSDADVKAFARRLVVDHTTANDELQKLAETRNVTLRIDPMKNDPTTPAATPLPTSSSSGQSHATHASLDHLRMLEGAAFDKAFIDHMVKDHEAVIEMFEDQADEGKDAEVKDWAEKKLRALKEHLRIAKDLQDRISR